MFIITFLVDPEFIIPASISSPFIVAEYIIPLWVILRSRIPMHGVRLVPTIRVKFSARIFVYTLSIKSINREPIPKKAVSVASEFIVAFFIESSSIFVYPIAIESGFIITFLVES